MYKILTLVVILLSGCSSISPYSGKSPVDDALKACGLGYSSEAGAVVKAAYNISEKSGGIDFSTSLKENLNTQIMAFASIAVSTGQANQESVVALLKGTQECVVNTISASKPKTRAELLSDCADDLQNKVAGKGKKWPEVKQTFPVTQHPDFSENKLIMTAFVDRGGSSSYSLLVSCNIKDEKYQGLEVIDHR